MQVLKLFRYKIKVTMINCCWQTHATHCITVNVLQTNKVDAQCAKLATELSWQRFASEVVNFQLLHLHLNCPTCIWWPRLNFAGIFGIRKLESTIVWRGVVCVILRLAVSAQHRLVTDGQRDAQRQLIPAPASVVRVKRKPYYGCPAKQMRTLYFHPVVTAFFLLVLFSSPNLSRRRLDVYHTFTHGVALVRI